jgi:hypothetical protein
MCITRIKLSIAVSSFLDFVFLNVFIGVVVTEAAVGEARAVMLTEFEFLERLLCTFLVGV